MLSAAVMIGALRVKNQPAEDGCKIGDNDFSAFDLDFTILNHMSCEIIKMLIGLDYTNHCQ